jgi:hypothetical protein
MAVPKAWKWYDKYPLALYADGCYQKIVYLREEKIAFDLVQYAPHPPQLKNYTYELNIQIPENVSITGMTINAKCFTYVSKNIDWKQIEIHAQAILKALVKKEFYNKGN